MRASGVGSAARETARREPASFAGIAMLAALALGFWPVLRWFVLRLNDGSDEPYGIGALAAAVFLCWKQRRFQSFTPARGWTLVLLLVANTALPASTPPLVRAFLAVAGIIALVWKGGGSLGLAGLFLLGLPVLATAQFYGGYILRVLAAEGAGILIGILGTPAFVAGTILEWHGELVAVDPPCSGLRMLWAGGCLVCFLSARSRLSSLNTILCCGACTAILICANAFRAAALFYKETGLLSLPDSFHEGIGLLAFALSCGAIVWIVPRFSPQAAPAPCPKQRSSISSAMAVCLFGVTIASAFRPFTSKVVEPRDEFPEAWPSTFENTTLVEIAPHESGAVFLKTFPGAVKIFRCGEDTIIVRYIAQPTRKLHASVECFRAAGWSVSRQGLVTHDDGSLWASAEAYRNGRHLRLEERIIGTGSGSWTDPSAWFWDAAVRGAEGPWWAFTRIREY
jgi:exosortase/archaeosortase family protein